jgi:hypothetical protein
VDIKKRKVTNQKKEKNFGHMVIKIKHYFHFSLNMKYYLFNEKKIQKSKNY